MSVVSSRLESTALSRARPGILLRDDQGAMEPRVSVLILNWNGLADTVECVDSFLQCDYPNFHILVIDNGSEEDDVAQLESRYGEHPSIALLRNGENLGFNRGMNAGIRKALELGTDYVLLMHNDNVVDPHFLTELVRGLAANPQAGIAGPRIYSYYRREEQALSAGWINWWTGDSYLISRKLLRLEKPTEVDYSAENGFLIRREVLQQIGLLPEDRFFGSTTEEYCLWARKKGFKTLFLPSAVAWHKVAAARLRFVQRPRQYWRQLLAQSVMSNYHFLRFLWRNSRPYQWPSQLLFYFGLRIPYVLYYKVKDPGDRQHLKGLLLLPISLLTSLFPWRSSRCPLRKAQPKG